MVRILRKQDDGTFIEDNLALGAMSEDDIHVRTLMTGVQSEYAGLAQVVAKGTGDWIVTQDALKVGDFVATSNEHAYADEYYCAPETWVKVPDADPKWILEPVAMGLNAVLETRHQIQRLCEVTTRNPNPAPRACIYGSEFQSKIIIQAMMGRHGSIPVDIIGSEDQPWWHSMYNYDLMDHFDGKFDIVYDTDQDSSVFTTDCINENACVIICKEKPDGIDTTFGNMLRNNVQMLFPNRTSHIFFKSMSTAKNWITEGHLKVDTLYTQQYNRDKADLEQQFDYDKGYMIWDSKND